ncbi:cytochrome P450 [Mycolicibacterium vaccae]|uniref:cytochrome P450 n=1 Tax=Mycolicibacterium vaccae TaxID=1810 RepID=UPI003CED223B
MTDTANAAAHCPVGSFDPLDPGTMQMPYPWYQALRREAPVHFVAERGMWFVTAYDLVSQALLDHEVFSSAFGLPQLPPPASVADEVAAISAQGWEAVPTLLTADPPEHHYYRRMVARAFTPRFVAQRQPAIRAIVDELLDGIPTGSPVEVVGALAAPLPLRIIAQALNVPDDRIDDFRRWSDQFAATIGAEIDDAGAVEQAKSLLEYQRYFAAQLDDRRTDPRDDLITGLVQASNANDDEPLSTGAALSIIQQLLIAGNETSRKLMTGMLHQLAQTPMWWEWLAEDPEGRAGAFVEESLRFLAPVQAMFRITKTEANLGGYTIPAGSMVVLVFSSASRDDAHFADGDEFDPQRPNAKSHLSFGQGIHACLGAPLARLQATLALQEIVRRYRGVTFADDNDFEYEPSFMLRGLKQLNLVFERR